MQLHNVQEMKDCNKWRGSVRKTVGAPMQKVWKIARDFTGINKWLPYMDTCERIEGEEQAPGCVRYCRGNQISGVDHEKSWAKEKLLVLDEENHSYSYSLIDSNLGIDGYIASVHVQEAGNGTHSVVDWSFEANPSEDCTEDQFIGLICSSLEEMIQRIGEANT